LIKNKTKPLESTMNTDLPMPISQIPAQKAVDSAFIEGAQQLADQGEELIAFYQAPNEAARQAFCRKVRNAVQEMQQHLEQTARQGSCASEIHAVAAKQHIELQALALQFRQQSLVHSASVGALKCQWSQVDTAIAGRKLTATPFDFSGEPVPSLPVLLQCSSGIFAPAPQPELAQGMATTATTAPILSRLHGILGREAHLQNIANAEVVGLVVEVIERGAFLVGKAATNALSTKAKASVSDLQGETKNKQAEEVRNILAKSRKDLTYGIPTTERRRDSSLAVELERQYNIPWELSDSYLDNHAKITRFISKFAFRGSLKVAMALLPSVNLSFLNLKNETSAHLAASFKNKTVVSLPQDSGFFSVSVSAKTITAIVPFGRTESFECKLRQVKFQGGGIRHTHMAWVLEEEAKYLEATGMLLQGVKEPRGAIIPEGKFLYRSQEITASNALIEDLLIRDGGPPSIITFSSGGPWMNLSCTSSMDNGQ
jgi:hypothetical protein